MKGGDCMLTHNIVNILNQLDRNNLKALKVISLAVLSLENGCEDFDIIEILEVVKDYLTANNKMFDSLS